MLLELEIENFTLVDQLSLSFREGLNVLTGETGAGKSLVLDSLNFLLGGDVKDASQRSRASRISGRFVAGEKARELLTEWELQDPDEPDHVLLTRELRSGRSNCRINNRLATMANLRDIGAELVDLHGQHQHQLLQKPSKHLEMVDRLAGEEHLDRLAGYRVAHREVRSLEHELEELRQAERERIREIEWLEKELDEIEQAQPLPGEEDELESELGRLSAVESLQEGCAEAEQCLSGETTALDQVARAARVLRDLRRHDPQLDGLCEQLAETEIQLSEISRELSSYSGRLFCDPTRLDEVQSRLELLKRLKRKYGADLREVLEYAVQTREKLGELRNAEARMEDLQGERTRAVERRDELARRLGSARLEAGRQLEAQVVEELLGLGMDKVQFEVRFESLEEPGASGRESAQFFMSPNPGTAPGPLAKVASGGELSRVMLALIALFSRYAPVPTMVFDEIDAGLGGRAAEAVAGRLRDLAGRCQVLCVTHLAVIAAVAGHHLKVHKVVEADTTALFLQELGPEERELEVARMLSGDATPDAAHQHARELIARSTPAHD